MTSTKNKEVSNEIYFMILYKSEQKEMPDFKKSEIKPKNILTKNLQGQDGSNFYNIVYKFQSKVKDDSSKKDNYSFELEIGDQNYLVSFDVKDNSFIYDVELKRTKKIIINITRENIDQNLLHYGKKFNYFIEALKKNNEENKFEILYKDTVDLYSTKIYFSLLIPLFVQIYKNKELCPLLMEKFKETNIKIKDNSYNKDRKKDLEQYKKNFGQISSEADNIIKSNGYDSIQFYGIILSYLNYYDYDNFLKFIDKLRIENSEVLFEILNIYFLQFRKNIKQNVDFYTKFISYTASKNEFYIFEKRLNHYIKDLGTFITVIEKTKKQITNKYVNSFNSKENAFRPIKIKDNIPLIKRERNSEMDIIIPAIESIFNFSKEEKVLLVYFPSNFWQKFLEDYKEPNDTNIYNCYRLRELLINYNDLVNDLFKNDKRSDIKKEINKFFDKDDFAILLDKNIKEYLDKYNKELTNAEILGFIEGFNPYYKEEKYSNKRKFYFFDYINFNDKNEQFIRTFKNLKFEKIFKDNITEFLKVMISKINNISNFGTIIDLINIKNFSKIELNYYFTELNDKYEKFVKKQIESLTGEQLKEGVKIVVKYFDLKFIRDKNCKFIGDKINKLNKKIGSLIYYELLRRCKGDEYTKMREFINEKLNIDVIINLIDYLDEKDRNIFLKEIINNCKFTKEEFYSNNANNKFLLLYDLYEKGKQKINYEIYFLNIEKILGEIIDEIEGEISIKKLNEFLKNEKVVIKKLGLIKIILEYFNPEQFYQDLKNIIQKINGDVKDLTFIKNSLQIFHREKYRKEIKTISRILKEMKEKSIKNYKTQKMQTTIQTLKYLKSTADQVETFKDFLFFRILYDNEHGNDQDKIFHQAKFKIEQIQILFDKKASANEIYQNNKVIFDKIKDMLCNDESKAKKFIEQMVNFFKIKEKALTNDLTIIFKSKKYEIDLKSIIYFFESFQKDNNDWNNKLSSKYINLSGIELEELKKNLKELKDNGIYDYEKENNYCKLFTALYEKKEAIDFLLTKTDKEIHDLYGKIEPTNPTITKENIQDTEDCVKIFNKLKELNDNFQIFKYIKAKLNNKEVISKFEYFSKNYSTIIELEINYNISENIYERVNNIIKDAKFTFRQNDELFSYGQDNKTTMKELIHLKNKIYIKNSKEVKDELGKKLEIFKNIISNLEEIYEYIKVLRIKGSFESITIQIMYPNIKYFLNNEIISFEKIKVFLFLEKAKYITQLDSMYKQKEYLRFLFGNQFNNILKHLDGHYNAIDFLRYILNKTDNKELIKDDKDNKNIDQLIIEDYALQSKTYCDISIDNIENLSNYLASLFEKNGTSLQKHYETMLIKDKNRYKGIYIYKCENESKEEFILNAFWNNIGQLPIAQNILIMSKESSNEEIQAFFYRAILCDYNTLFIVQINDTFSDSQQNMMFTYIDELLSYKNEKYKESQNKKNIEKSKTREYLNSCIIFIYEQNNKNLSFLNQLMDFGGQQYVINLLPSNRRTTIRKYFSGSALNQELLKAGESIKLSRYNTSLIFEKEKNLFPNIKVITSDICGLGKTYQIKKMIEKNKKKYFHLLLGGKITKTDIFKKLSCLLEKIKKEIKEDNYKEVAIHLDLFESQELSIINEFLFSFLITKFYNNNENIIYIPKDIDIYIEIPNCFENYFSKFSILEIFNRKNISTLSNLDLPQDLIDIFNILLEFNSNDKIEQFIKENIGFNKYSYHQVQIFIKLFLYQYNKFKSKLIFYSEGNEGNEVTEECIKEFGEFTKNFTNEGFSKLLINNIENDEERDYIEILSEIYDNDLKGKIMKIPLTNNINDKMIYNKFIIPESSLTECTKNYLQNIKEIFDLPNEVENDLGDKKSLLSILDYKIDNYVIIKDNFKKMVLLAYRIKANIPVIIMGETGCGKTTLIIKLNQILNNGEITVKTINMHPWTTDEDIFIKMKEIDEDAKNNKEKEIWVFFDEINTCLSMPFLTEIFINRTYNGEKLSENIRLIGACNPYRKRKENTEKFGLNRDQDNENELVYLVKTLPQSLLYYVFSFGLINEEDEKNYIYSIIDKLFTKEENNLHEVTRDAIFECHKFLRELFDPSVVSLREIFRFSKCVEFFQKYYTIKNDYEIELNENNEIKNEYINNKEKLYKIKSIICSIYICYYIRLSDDKRTIFNCRLREILLKLVNIGESEQKKYDEEKESEEGNNLIDEIYYEQLKFDLRDEIFNQFSDLLKIEEDFLLDKIDLDKGIGKNNLLKENVFLLFLSVITKIPLIIIGNPGTGKSLSAQLIYKSMRGKYSKNKFFQKFPQIIQTYLQGSDSTKPEDVEKLFEIAENKLQYYIKKGIKKEELPISMILFDELGLAEKSEIHPLQVLHSKLEFSGKDENISFIGISNYSLDSLKNNRVLNLSIPFLEDKIDQLINTSKSIVESISEDLSNNIVFEILSRTYYEYKNTLIFIKELTAFKQFESQNKQSNEPIDLKNKQFSEIKNIKEFKNILKKDKVIKLNFHGNRDLYNLIKGIATEFGKSNNLDDSDAVSTIEKYIERNFGGIDYEIDIDLDLKKTDIEDKIKFVNEILKDFFNIRKKQKYFSKEKDINNEKVDKLKVSSVFLFKKIYNLVCGAESPYKISKNNIEKYDLNNCINENINDLNTRYLLLEIKPSLASLIYQNIKLQNPDKITQFKEGSPFLDDNNNYEYRYKKVNEIQEYAKSEELIISQNLNEIQTFLYDLYNKNYIIKDKNKCARICLDSFNDQLTPVNDYFRIINLVDKKFIYEADIEFLNRLEKIKISFDKLLDKEQITLSNKIIDEINFKYYIEEYQDQINYSLEDLLINSGKDEIEGLIYNYSIGKNKINEREENTIKEIVYNKISNMLPQDIIAILPDDHKIAKTYYEEKQYYNLKEYIADEENKKKKISIIYTFSNISNIINDINNEMRFMVSSIKTENQLKNIIDEIKNKNESNSEKNNNNIFIHFEQMNSKKIQFISSFIFNRLKSDSYNYIFIIHIKRNFKSQINNDIIYSLPDINPNINQIFLDNLNAINIKLKDLFDKNIKDIFVDNAELMDLDKEFDRTLKNFIYDEITEEIINSNNTNENNLFNKDTYNEEIQKYIDEEVVFKRNIIEKAKELIDNDKEAEGKCKSLIDKMFRTNYIGKNSLDIISCLLDYIKEQIFGKYLKHIFTVLEDNNILTTLLEIKKNKDNILDERIIEQLKDYFLNRITMENKTYEPKFLLNYKIPGLFNFYKNLSNYIKEKISIHYFNNETKLREYFGKEIEKEKLEFHEKEEDLLSLAYDEIRKDKFIFDITNKIHPDLLLKDYITFYLDKYITDDNIISNINNKLIELLLKLRFNEDNNQIIKNNHNYPIKTLLIKIMWIESNVNYIISILKIFSYAKELFNDGDKLYKMMEELIYNENTSIKYVINEKRNPEHTREVNECYYIILASLCLSVTSEDIHLQLTKSIYSENKIEINQYCKALKKMNNILQNLNNDLFIYLNEMYIIDELKEVIELQKLKDINTKKIEEIRKYLRESALIIQNSKTDKNKELIENFKKIYDSLILKKIETENKKYINKYYDTLKYICFKEISKITETKYRCKILEYLLKEKEIIKKSNDILQILFKKYISVKTGEKEFKKNLHYISKDDNKIFSLIDKNLSNNKKDTYLALSETLLYYFEKISISYFKNALYDIKKPILLENEPLDVFKECITFLHDYLENPKKLEKENKLKNISMLFCLGYIKAFCFTFIKAFDDIEPKFKDLEKIIEFIDKNDLKKMVKFYIYKILFNQKQLDALLNPKSKEKYKLEKYRGFKEFIKIPQEYQINYGFETLDNDNYERIYKTIEKYKLEDYKNKIKKEEINSGEFFIDNFYYVSKNLILTNLKNKSFETSKIFDNFYQNICKPLFEKSEKEKLSTVIQFFFNPQKYEEIRREYGINNSNIEAILYGYRYCLNELSDENENGIYSTLYERDNIGFLSEKFYPGSDFSIDNKNTGKLGSISFRLLNYILYSHLFFARILTNLKRFDNYVHKFLDWGKTLNECWTLLKNELSKEGINSIEIFMDFTFKALYNKLHNKEYIDNYEELIDFEEKLEELIQEKIELVKNENEKYKKLMDENNEDKNSFINILKEKYDSQNYPQKEFPFYEYFYYCDYLDEKNISEKLNHMDESKYPTLKKYLDFIKGNDENNNNNDYSLDNLSLFNNVFNLFNEKYSDQITREYAEKTILKDDEIYKNEGNKKIIDDFIKCYNKLKLRDSNGNLIELKADKNHLCDFVLDDSNEIGKTYINIYKHFIKNQNEEIEYLFNIKIHEEILDSNNKNKINIQQIRKEEIFTFKKFQFINVVFNSSYRKIIDNKNYEIYNQYEINFDTIEEAMTDLLLKNKKLVNNDIIKFSYINEVFSNEVKDLITLFNKKYKTKKISSEEKEIIDNFIKENKSNKIIYKYIINDFITIIHYLNDQEKEDKDKDKCISEKTKIYEIFEKLKNSGISKEFLLIFKDKNELTINKISSIFEYFLKSIFKYVRDELKDYQEELEDNEKDLEDKKNKLDEYYQKEPLISKDNFVYAIRLFMTLVLYREEDKEKIKYNSKNIFYYLKAPDLWDKNKYNDEKFNENINKLKKINIKINQIIWLYNYLVGNKQEIKSKITKEYKDNKKEEKDDKVNKKEEEKSIISENENVIEETIIISEEIEDNNDNDNEIELKEK